VRVSRPKVKICGVTRVEEALWAADSGADFVGLNFHPPSPRFVGVATAAGIADAVRGRVRLVGVFVDRPLDEVEAITEAVGLDLLQFHGDEPAETLAPVAERAIKVFRVEERIDPAAVAGFDDVWGYLFDARHPRLWGGSGRSWTLASLRHLDVKKPAFVAGGLGPDTVRAAIAACAPWGIDVCSGVESAPGRKDRRLLDKLFEEVEDVAGLQLVHPGR